MTNKQALREAAEKAGADNHTQDEWFHYLRCSYPATVLALLDELEVAEKRIAELPGQKHLIGWRMADYTGETADPALAKNWATAVDVLPIFEGDVNTKLGAAMLQGASGNSPAIPDGWIPFSIRPPESMPGSCEYIVFETLNNRAHHDYWNVPDKGDDEFTPFWNHYDGYVTHWMPLPAAPQQEVK